MSRGQIAAWSLLAIAAIVALLLWADPRRERSADPRGEPAERIESGGANADSDPPPPAPDSSTNSAAPSKRSVGLRIRVIDEIGATVEGAVVTAALPEAVVWDGKEKKIGVARTDARGIAVISVANLRPHSIVVTHPRMFRERGRAWPDAEVTIEMQSRGAPSLILKAVHARGGPLTVPLLYHVSVLHGAGKAIRGEAEAPIVLHLPEATSVEVDIGARGHRYVSRKFDLSGGTREATVELPAAALCDGVAVDAESKQVIPGARVWTGGRFGDAATADASGRFRLHGMMSVEHDGVFSIWAKAPGYGIGRYDAAVDGETGFTVELPPLEKTRVRLRDAKSKKYVAGVLELRRVGHTESYAVPTGGVDVGFEANVVHRVRTRAYGHADGFAVCCFAPGDFESLEFPVVPLVSVRIRVHRREEALKSRRFVLSLFESGIPIHAKGERNVGMARAESRGWGGLLAGATDQDGNILLRLGSGERHKLQLGSPIPELSLTIPTDRAEFDVDIDAAMFD